jgi:hypothetical protein
LRQTEEGFNGSFFFVEVLGDDEREIKLLDFKEED